MDGVISVYKSTGPTSHDVINSLRHIFHQKRIGHAGTLDPLACGVLVVCLGKATRIVEYIVSQRKRYVATLALGSTTDTEDSTGTILQECSSISITADDLEESCSAFRGEIAQIPPMVSALKHNGQPLYKLARAGHTIERDARPVTIYSLKVLSFIPGERATAQIEVECSTGTYIRTLCADIGDKLQVGGHMASLERTMVGRYSSQSCVTIEELAASDDPGKFLGGISEALSDMPAVVLDELQYDAAVHGRKIILDGDLESAEVVRMLDADGGVVGVGRIVFEDNVYCLKPHKILADMSD